MRSTASFVFLALLFTDYNELFFRFREVDVQ